MFDFKVKRGVNRLKAQIFLYNTKPNGYNLGRWVSQWEQTIMAIGPVNQFFLNRIWQVCIYVLIYIPLRNSKPLHWLYRE